MEEEEARRYFQQLISAVQYCHSKGLYHRDLKPENLMLKGKLKVSGFGFSALSQQLVGDGLLHPASGTPNYAAPEVLKGQGYDEATADLWSCGVILFVLLAGYSPFEDSDPKTLNKMISSAEFSCPPWLSSGANNSLVRILDPNPTTVRYSVYHCFQDILTIPNNLVERLELFQCSILADFTRMSYSLVDLSSVLKCSKVYSPPAEVVSSIP